MCKTLEVEYDREADGRWIADIPSFPGVMAYGKTKADARRNVFVLLLRVMADDIEEKKSPPASLHVAVA